MLTLNRSSSAATALAVVATAWVQPAAMAGDTMSDADAVAAEFDGICAGFVDSDEPFYGERNAIALRARRDAGIASLAPRAQFSVYAGLGWEELKLGNPKASIEALDAAIDLLRKGGGGGPLLQRLRGMLIVAHLQAAEDENCVAHHSSGSCLLPIDESGVHRLPMHARMAGDLSLAMALETKPGPALLWSLNFARMVAGQYPQGVPEEWRLPADAFSSSESFERWPDRAPALGINAVDLAGGAIVDDFDGDGHLDLISSSCHPCASMKAFRNDGQGGFVDVSERWGLSSQRGGLNVVHADYDNDGQLDLLVLRGGWLHDYGRVRNSLLRNDLAGSGRFVDVTRAVGMAEPAYPTQTAAWADYDNDGDVDVYIGNEGSGTAPYPSQLFRNDGAGGFVDVAAQAGVTNDRYTKAVTWGDYDNDGDADLYVSTNNSANRLYRNDGDGRFKDVAETLGVERPTARSFASWFFDYDNDGWLDLFVANFENPPAKVMASYFGATASEGAPMIYHNDAGKGFSDRAADLGVTRPLLPMGANYGDIDNDGWLDFYLGTGEPAFEAQVPNVMYRNANGAGFVDVTFSGGFGHIQKGHGVAFGDIDNDGDQDLFHQLGGFYPGDAFGNALFENPGNSNRWLSLELRGTQSNRFGVGARIAVDVDTEQGPRTIHLLAGSGGSFGGSSMRQEIGLGAALGVRGVSIVWPSGIRQRLDAPGIDRLLRVVEPSAIENGEKK